jgi:hypothetical protein
MISDDEFIGLHRAEFARAARLQYRILYVQIATAFLACFAVYLSDATAAYLLAVLTGIAALVWAYLARAYRSSRSLAERVRRATVITSAFAAPISAPDKRDVMTRFSVSVAEGQRFTDTDYYAADDPPGLARLAAIIEESAFWSCVLLRKSADRTWFVFAAFLALAFVLLFSTLPFVSAQEWLGGVRLLCAIVPLFVSTDVFGAASAYGSSAEEVKDVQARLTLAKASDYPVADLFSIWGDYNSAVESAPIYPPGLYKRYRDELNRLWKNR